MGGKVPARLEPWPCPLLSPCLLGEDTDHAPAPRPDQRGRMMNGGGRSNLCMLPRWPACRCRRHDSIPGLGRSPGGGNGNLLSCSFLENPMDRGAWRAAVHRVTELDMTEQLSTQEKLTCFHPVWFGVKQPGWLFTGRPGTDEMG